jgi:hypothetical protein
MHGPKEALMQRIDKETPRLERVFSFRSTGEAPTAQYYVPCWTRDLTRCKVCNRKVFRINLTVCPSTYCIQPGTKY